MILTLTEPHPRQHSKGALMVKEQSALSFFLRATETSQCCEYVKK